VVLLNHEVNLLKMSGLTSYYLCGVDKICAGLMDWCGYGALRIIRRVKQVNTKVFLPVYTLCKMLVNKWWFAAQKLVFKGQKGHFTNSSEPLCRR